FNLDPTSVYAARSLSLIYLFTHRIDDAVAILEPLLKSNPGNDSVVMRLGDVDTYAGQPQRGIDLMLGVYQRDPRYPGVGHAFIGRAFFSRHRRAGAARQHETTAPRRPPRPPPRGGGRGGYRREGRGQGGPRRATGAPPP